MKKFIKIRENGVLFIKLEVEVNGVLFSYICNLFDKKIVMRIVIKVILKYMKESIFDL